MALQQTKGRSLSVARWVMAHVETDEDFAIRRVLLLRTVVWLQEADVSLHQDRQSAAEVGGIELIAWRQRVVVERHPING